MYLVQIFRSSPVTGVSICVCLGTIFWCLLLVQKHRSRIDRFLIGLVGFITVYQALRLLKDTGVFSLGGVRAFDLSLNFAVSALCLTAVLLLRLSCLDRSSIRLRLRLVEANEKVSSPAPAAPMPAQLTTAVMESAPVAIFATDLDGKVSYWNASAERLLGWKREEVLGQRAPVAIEADEGGAFVTQLRSKAGQAIDAAAWTAPFRNSTGSVKGTLIVIGDLSNVLAEAKL